MKRLIIIISLLASAAWATDLSQMSTEEMKNTRGMGKGGGQQCCLTKMPTFEQYDLNNDGKITQNELKDARAKRMNQKAKEGKMLRNAGNAPAFSEMDKNKDGSLNQEEFRLHKTEQMKKCNKRNSATGNCPTPSKVNCPNKGKRQGKGMMRNTGNAPAFTDIDTNNDGMISQEEFSAHQTQRMKNRGNCPGGNCP